MEVTISGELIVEFAALLTALGVIGGAALWGVKFVARQKKQDQELAAIRKEQQLICYGVMACPVTAALDKLEKHLNQAAHEEDS